MQDRLDSMARELEASGLFKVLRRFDAPQSYSHEDGSAKALAVIVDVETTGFSCETDKIIQFAMLPFFYAKDSGHIYTRGETLTYLEDPGGPIPPEITALTGITDSDVAGQRIDDAAVEDLLRDAVIVIAHSAGFDRPFLERRMPSFEQKAWACSVADVPWAENGIAAAKLEYLLYRHCNQFFDGHRADIDCLATLHILATPFPSGHLPFQSLLDSARQSTVRIWAQSTSIEHAPVLKSRRYRWNDGTDGRPRAWYRDVPLRREAEEIAWLEATVYLDQPRGWTREVFTAFKRYTEGY